MLKIAPEYVRDLYLAQSAEDLHRLVEQAIRLEFSTIPPYLTAMLSLHPGTNRGIWGTIHEVVVDEMLHMTIACNILNAVGGRPPLADPSFLPTYPGSLPMGIGDDLVVGLEPFTTDLMKRVFMEIEEPEEPIHIPTAEAARDLPQFSTIGAFYTALAHALERLGDSVFVGDPERQAVPTTWFGDRAFPILNVADAVRAIALIIEEGEGTPASPLDPDGEFAHYYRFEEIWRLKRIAPDPSAPGGYSFSGPTIPFDPAAVWPITPNQRLADLDHDSLAGRRASRFSFVFTKLMQALDRTFDGSPERFEAAMGLMFELKLAGQALVQLPAIKNGQNTERNAGPTFEFRALPV